MQSTTLVTTCALGAMLFAGGPGLPSAMAEPGTVATAAATGTGTRLTPPQLYDMLDAAGYSAVGKIDRKPGSPTYEVRATDRHGLRQTLHLDARTGATVRSGVQPGTPVVSVARTGSAQPPADR